MHTGRISSKHQLTLPTELVRALHLRTGDTLEFRLTPHHTLELLPLRPDFDFALEQFLQDTPSGEGVPPTGQPLEHAHSYPTPDALPVLDKAAPTGPVRQSLTLEPGQTVLPGVSHD